LLDNGVFGDFNINRSRAGSLRFSLIEGGSYVRLLFVLSAREGFGAMHVPVTACRGDFSKRGVSTSITPRRRPLWASVHGGGIGVLGVSVAGTIL